MHLLYKHKDKFNSYVGTFSDEHGERLHKDFIEIRFKQCLNKEMLAECIWSLKRATNLYKSTKNVLKLSTLYLLWLGLGSLWLGLGFLGFKK